MTNLPLTLHFTGTPIASTSSPETDVQLVVFIPMPTVSNITGQNGITTIDNLPGAYPMVGEMVFIQVTPTSLATSSPTPVLTSVPGTITGTRKITFASSAPATLTTASAIGAQTFMWPSVTVQNGTFIFKTTTPTTTSNFVSINFFEPMTAIERSFTNLAVTNVSVSNNIYTVTTAPQSSAFQDGTITETSSLIISNLSVLSSLSSTDLTFTYNIPQWISNIPCLVTPHNFITSSTGTWILYISGISQPHTTELISDGTQFDASTRVAISSALADIQPFYGILPSGRCQFVFTLKNLIPALSIEDTFKFGLSLTFTPI